MKKFMIIVMALAMMAMPVLAWSEAGCANRYNITFPYADLNNTKIPITLTTPTDFNSSDIFIRNGADDTRLAYALENSTRAWVLNDWTSANTTQLLVYYNCSGTGGTSEQVYDTFMVNFSDTFDTDLSQWNMMKNASDGVMEIVNDSHGDNILHMRGGSNNDASGFQFAETYQNVPLELQVDYDLGIFDSTAYTYGARTFFWGADDNLTADFTNNFYFIWGTGYQNGFRFSQRINSTDINGDVQTGDLNSNAWNHYTLKFYKNVTGDGYYYANVKTTGDVTYYNGNTEYTFTLGENFTDTGFRKYILYVNPSSIDMWYDNLTIKYYAQEPILSYSEETPSEENITYYVNWTLSPANESTNVSITPRLYYQADSNYNTSMYRMAGSIAHIYDENGTEIDTPSLAQIVFNSLEWFDMSNWLYHSSLNYSTTYQWRVEGFLYDSIAGEFVDYPTAYTSDVFTFTTEEEPTTTTTTSTTVPTTTTTIEPTTTTTVPTTTTTVIEAPTGDIIAVTGNMIYALVVLLMAGFMFYIVKERFGK